MARKKKKSEPAESEWITTYSDMVTLLLCFFVILYSFSSVDSQRFQAFAEAMAKGFGTGGSGFFQSSSVTPAPTVGNPAATNSGNKGTGSSANEIMFNEVLKYMKDNNMEAKVQIRQERRGVVIELKENVLFDSGRAELRDDSMQVLKKIGGLLKKFPNDVIVEGHTDNLPIRSGYYQSNWELSTDRAVKVVRYYTDIEKMSGNRFVAVGCGEYKPIDTNDTNEGRKNNRRVNILIVTSDKESGDN